MKRKIIVSLVAALAAVLPVHQSQAKDCRGVYEITQTDETSFGSYLAWNDTNIHGILIRETWAHVEPAKDRFHWTDITNTLTNYAQVYSKTVIISIDCGISLAPSWIYTDGAGSFTLSDGQTIAPWDATAQSFLTSLFSHLSSKFDRDTTVVAVTMWCGGTAIECNFCDPNQPSDKANLDNLAGGTGLGGNYWLAGAKAIVPMYSGFFNTTIYLATGNPYPDSNSTMQALVHYFNGYWGGTNGLGLQSNGLTITHPSPTSQTFPHCNTTACDTYTGKIGFQSAHAYSNVPGDGTCAQKLTNAQNHHARWVEIYSGDINQDVTSNSENGIKNFNTYAAGLP